LSTGQIVLWKIVNWQNGQLVKSLTDKIVTWQSYLAKFTWQSLPGEVYLAKFTWQNLPGKMVTWQLCHMNLRQKNH